MGQQRLKIYICSNVGIDYFFFLGRTISEAGFDVQPIFLVSETNYRRLAKSSGLKKIWLRVQMYMLYPMLLIFRALTSSRNSIFVITSNNFFAPYLTYLFLKIKGGKVIHLLYDLYPDAIEIAGAIKVNSFVSKTIGKVMSKNLKKCNASVYLGEFLRNHAENRWGKAPISKTIDISTDLDLYSESFNPEIESQKLIVHYGGQLGHLHDAVSLIESIKHVYNSDISESVEFNFYVSGAQAQFLENSLKEFPVKIISAVPSHQWREDIKNFHIGMVSLSPGGASVCLPSKTYGMMAGGLAILAVCPEWSDLANLVRSIDAGWIINNSVYNNADNLKDGDYLNNIKKGKETSLIADNFYQQLKNILNDRNDLNKKRRNAFDGVRKYYNIRALSVEWQSIINELL